MQSGYYSHLPTQAFCCDRILLFHAKNISNDGKNVETISTDPQKYTNHRSAFVNGGDSDMKLIARKLHFMAIYGFVYLNDLSTVSSHLDIHRGPSQ